MPKKQSLSNWLQTHVVSTARVHFAYAVVYIFAIVVFDAWNLITPDNIIERWMVAAALLIVTSLVWYAAQTSHKSELYYKGLAYLLIGIDLFVATYGVYSQRGIASKSVVLYVIPIIVSAVLLSRVAIFAVTTISVALYSAACVKYFYLNQGQAYKVELYGEIAFFSGILFIVAALLWALIKTRDK